MLRELSGSRSHIVTGHGRGVPSVFSDARGSLQVGQVFSLQLAAATADDERSSGKGNVGSKHSGRGGGGGENKTRRWRPGYHRLCRHPGMRNRRE